MSDSLLFEDFFDKVVSKDKAGFVVAREMLPSGTPLLYSLRSKLLLYEELQVSFQVGAMRKNHSHCVVLFCVPRAGFRFCWSAPGMYTALKLLSYSRKPSKWVYGNSEQ